jgi:hypothetical protein
MRASSLRSTARGKLCVASVAASHISASTPAFCAVTLRAPPRTKSPAATVWLPARRLTSTFSPLTSNSVTSDSAVAATSSSLRASGAGVCAGAAAPFCGAGVCAGEVADGATSARATSSDLINPPANIFSAFTIRSRVFCSFVMVPVPDASLAARQILRRDLGLLLRLV